MWYLSFSAWLISLSMITSRSIHVVANGKTSFFFLWLINIPLCIYNHIVFIHSYIDGHLGYFHILHIVNDAAVNMDSLEHSGVLGRLGTLIVEVTSGSHRNSLEGNQVAKQWGATSGCAANWKLMFCEVAVIHCGSHLIAIWSVFNTTSFSRPKPSVDHWCRLSLSMAVSTLN